MTAAASPTAAIAPPAMPPVGAAPALELDPVTIPLRLEARAGFVALNSPARLCWAAVLVANSLNEASAAVTAAGVAGHQPGNFRLEKTKSSGCSGRQRRISGFVKILGDDRARFDQRGCGEGGLSGNAGHEGREYGRG
jgi:hypothetical protein